MFKFQIVCMFSFYSVWCGLWFPCTVTRKWSNTVMRADEQHKSSALAWPERRQRWAAWLRFLNGLSFISYSVFVPKQAISRSMTRNTCFVTVQASVPAGTLRPALSPWGRCRQYQSSSLHQQRQLGLQHHKLYSKTHAEVRLPQAATQT